MVNDE
jgi:hypothetical protein